MKDDSKFPIRFLLEQPGRSKQLLREYYEKHHKNRELCGCMDGEKKAGFFEPFVAILAKNGFESEQASGIDLGCRGGVLARRIGKIDWVGVDIDQQAIDLANANGVPCIPMDISVGIDLQSASFDVVLMTEVIEHLPFPSITVREVHRILKKRPGSLFMGSAPLDYHLHRRWSVMRGRRLEGDPTHIHHFSFNELDHLLRHYFKEIHYKPLRGTAARHPKWRLPFQHFVRDIAWVARAPIEDPEDWAIRIIH